MTCHWHIGSLHNVQNFEFGCHVASLHLAVSDLSNILQHCHEQNLYAEEMSQYSKVGLSLLCNISLSKKTEGKVAVLGPRHRARHTCGPAREVEGTLLDLVSLRVMIQIIFIVMLNPSHNLQTNITSSEPQTPFCNTFGT